MISQNTIAPKIVQDGLYLVYSDGRIYRRGHQSGELDELCPYVIRGDYYIVTSTHPVTRKQHQHAVHRLLAEAFVDNDDPEHQTLVRFKDGRKHNIQISNLVWESHSDIESVAYSGTYLDGAPCNVCGDGMLTRVNTTCKSCRAEISTKRKEIMKTSQIRRAIGDIYIDDLKSPIKEYVTMRLDGHTYQDIADTYSVTRQAVHSGIKNAVKTHKNKTL